jgi:N-acetylglutamate synthase-like GNAT family acetyltransferase
MNIRKAQERDRIRSLEIIVSCLSIINSKDYSSETIETLIHKYNKNFMKIPEVHIIIIESNEKVLGTAGITEQGQIRDVFIDIQYHRKGLGTLLMHKLEEIAKNKKSRKVFLFAALSSVNFYAKLGYSIIKEYNFGNEGIQIKMEKKI